MNANERESILTDEGYAIDSISIVCAGKDALESHSRT